MCLTNKIAVLIDGDNAQSKHIEYYLKETGVFGKITIKRIYADWTKPEMNNWKNVLNKNAIRPMQKFAHTTGKNATDMALIIDAMDILHSGKVNGFCIVSSDSDFTSIATRIREEGLFIMGIGKSHTPESFRNACEKFVFEEIFDNTTTKKEKKKTEKSNIDTNTPKLPGPKIIGKIDLDLIEPLKKKTKKIDKSVINQAFENVVDINNGLALLSRFAEAIRKIDSSFDHRNYGFGSFIDFCRNLTPDYHIVKANDNTTYSIKKTDENAHS